MSWENQGVDIWEGARLLGALKTKQISTNNVVGSPKEVITGFKQGSDMKSFQKEHQR